MSIPALNTAAESIQANMRAMEAAQGVAASGSDFVGQLMATKEAGMAIKANAAVIKSTDEMIGSLLDILA